jgi:hypothetical protein
MKTPTARHGQLPASLASMAHALADTTIASHAFDSARVCCITSPCTWFVDERQPTLTIEHRDSNATKTRTNLFVVGGGGCRLSGVDQHRQRARDLRRRVTLRLLFRAAQQSHRPRKTQRQSEAVDDRTNE